MSLSAFNCFNGVDNGARNGGRFDLHHDNIAEIGADRDPLLRILQNGGHFSVSADELLDVVGSDDNSTRSGSLGEVVRFDGLVDGGVADDSNNIGGAIEQTHNLLLDSTDGNN